jgi:hypothetical protein
VIALLATVALAAATPTLSVDLEPREVRIGEPVRVTLTVTGHGDSQPRFPVWQAHWGKAEVVESEEPELRAGSWRQTVVVAAYSTGRVVLPPPQVAVEGLGALAPPAEPAAFEVLSVLPEAEDEVEPRPPAPPLSVGWGSEFWWTASALGLLCAGLVVLGARRARPPGALSHRTNLSPIDALSRELGVIDVGNGAIGWDRASDALRRYLGRVLDLPAIESTTSQLRRRLHSSAAPDALVRGALRILRRADEIKFARSATTPSELSEAIAAIGRLAGEIELFLNPPVEEPVSERVQAA